MLNLACFSFSNQLTKARPAGTVQEALLSRNNTNDAFLSVCLFTSTSANMKTQSFRRIHLLLGQS